MIDMKASSGRLALAIAIPLLVIPLAALAWLAARSVDQQESDMRARLRESLLLEVAQTNGQIDAWFADLPTALGANAPRSETSGKPTARELADWKRRDPLVGIPFLLDASGSIVFPKRDGAGAEEETRLFYWRYMNVFGNVERIPVYRNIATEYESSIVDAPERQIASAVKSAPEEGAAPDEQYAQAAEPMRESASEMDAIVPKEAEDISRAAPRESAKSAVRKKVAQSIFETDTAVQKQVYDLAAEEGKETLKRNVNPQIDAVDTRASAPARSVYIESNSYFRDLVARADHGLVPRIFDNSFVLLYWEKRGDWIVGCELDMEAVREAIAARGGAPADGVRYLAILDQKGEPLVQVANLEAAAWRTPLVSGEISEYLPYWETAVILADPTAFESRVRASRYVLSAFVVIMFLSVILGGIVLWRYSANRLLEAKRRTGFVTTVSHELKTPLTSIRMYSEMLADGADLDRAKRDRYLSRIVGESERLTKLINDVLDVAKLERGRARPTLVPIDVTQVARETLEGMADRLKREGFSVSFDAPERPAMALADRDAIVRVLVNLLSNAEKYSADEREISVTAKIDEQRRRCSVEVADRGIGVPRAHRSRIFREFHRADASITSDRGGTGLGLTIARSLARALGGDVIYAPRDRADGGRGSAFTLVLPLTKDTEEHT